MNKYNIHDLMVLCFYIQIVYCANGGHYCVRVDPTDNACPLGCNVY